MKKSRLVIELNRKVKVNGRRLKLLINRLGDVKGKKGLDEAFKKADKEVWEEVACLSCSNCCRTMTPTYTFEDKKRIAKHLGMSVKGFEEKWLYKEKKGDWRNASWPCQFLDKQTNYCQIYEIRPADCAGFPHHHKKNLIDYSPMLKQNISYCPASYLLVEKMYEGFKK